MLASVALEQGLLKHIDLMQLNQADPISYLPGPQEIAGGSVS